jgi:predicted lipoprotein with Yx(FWY)xxD motif
MFGSGKRFGWMAAFVTGALLLSACSAAATPSTGGTAPKVAPVTTPVPANTQASTGSTNPTSMPNPTEAATATEAPTVAPTPTVDEATATVKMMETADMGKFLTDNAGMTLYVFANDTANTSNCTGTCATNWPPLTVTSGTTPTAGMDVTGTLGTITRSDGSIQVTYNGMPLYHYKGDQKPGDTTGNGLLNGAWSVAKP